MRVIIAGGRDYGFTERDIAYLDRMRDEIPIREVVSGGARGADSCGEEWAESRGIPVTRFPADWKGLGPPAGPIRNCMMAEYADALIAFPGRGGTAHMIEQARLRGLAVYLAGPADGDEW